MGDNLVPSRLSSDPGMVGDIISEQWAELSRNGVRHHSGIVGGFARNLQRLEARAGCYGASPSFAGT